MTNVRILVLGHNGMLGRTIVRYFTEIGHNSVLTTATRWGDHKFLTEINNLKPDFIVNCIGKIPQKNPSAHDYVSINIELPRALETLHIPTIHPSTDCEFNGALAKGSVYTKDSIRDADDIYGKSKAQISNEIVASFNHTKIIRTSIIGHEKESSVALLDWFLSQSGTVYGYTNNYWNGLTTLQWAKVAEHLIENWGRMPALNQYGTNVHYSKFDILNIIKDVYQKDIEIIPFETNLTLNKCLLSDTSLPELHEQLTELKNFFRY
jgi:dTDP-4-dehydrorhamnose reductase